MTTDRSRPRVFISYKHGAHSPDLVLSIARLIEDVAHLDVWFDEQNVQELHKTPINQILKTFFPDVLSLLVGLQAFLQGNLEQSDVVLFLQPHGEGTTPKSSWIRKKPEGSRLASLRYFYQLFCLFWLVMFAMAVLPFLVVVFVGQFAVRSLTLIERDALPVWHALTHYWLSPIWWIRRNVTGTVVPVPVFDPRKLKLQRANLSFNVIAAVRSAFYYRVIYGIEFPPLRGPFANPASWQLWELEVAMALGLHSFKMALVDGPAPASAPNPEVTLVSGNNLLEDLRFKVLPYLSGRSRAPLQVARRFLKGLTFMLAGLVVSVAALLALLVWTLWFVGSWVMQLLVA